MSTDLTYEFGKRFDEFVVHLKSILDLRAIGARACRRDQIPLVQLMFVPVIETVFGVCIDEQNIRGEV